MAARYIPFVQQPYCCVAACLLSVMYRLGIPLLPQDELAYALGLIVPEEDLPLFMHARSGERPSAGWGTQIQDPRYEPNQAFARLGIPLRLEQSFIHDFKDVAGLGALLRRIQRDDADALLCFDYGRLWNLRRHGGHVCIFDHIDGELVYLIDPERNVPKYRQTTLATLYKAMDFHGDDNATGVWKLERL